MIRAICSGPTHRRLRLPHTGARRVGLNVPTRCSSLTTCRDPAVNVYPREDLELRPLALGAVERRRAPAGPSAFAESIRRQTERQRRLVDAWTQSCWACAYPTAGQWRV